MENIFDKLNSIRGLEAVRVNVDDVKLTNYDIINLCTTYCLNGWSMTVCVNKNTGDIDVIGINTIVPDDGNISISKYPERVYETHNAPCKGYHVNDLKMLSRDIKNFRAEFKKFKSVIKKLQLINDTKWFHPEALDTAISMMWDDHKFKDICIMAVDDYYIRADVQVDTHYICRCVMYKGNETFTLIRNGKAGTQDVKTINKETFDDYILNGMPVKIEISPDAMEIIQAAERGDASAQSALAGMYEIGREVPRDYSKAAKWHAKAAKSALRDCAKAAEQGDVGAQFDLAEIYGDGDVVRRDNAKAFEWYAKAAEQGHSEALYRLGRMYKDAYEIPNDDAKAFECYTKAAELGHAEAQDILGCRYEYGIGVPRDYIKAAEWYAKAAKQGHAFAQYNLAKMHEKGRIPPNQTKTAEGEDKNAH